MISHKRSFVFSLVLGFAFASFAIFLSSQMFAWTPAGHNKIGKTIGEAGGLASQHVDRLENQGGWADSDEAEDGNGTFGITEENNPWQDNWLYPFCCMTANYDHWENVATGAGHAPKNAKRFMGWAAQWYINNGYTNYGFKILGRGNHYIHDMSVSYHTIAWDNLDQSCEDTWDHFVYESWHNNNYKSKNFNDYLRWGAVYGSDYNVSSDDDIVTQTKKLAQETKQRHSEIKECQWRNDDQPTKWAMWDLGERLSSVNEYVAPGHFDF